MLDASAIVDGQRVIDIHLKRCREGILVNVKVTEEVEEFFRHWGGGVTESPSFGRFWKPQNGEKLSLWSFPVDQSDEDVSYSLAHTGAHFKNVENGKINISFIRLVGAVDGRSFIFDGVMSKPDLVKLSERMQRAAERFYYDYLHPVHLNVFVGVRDLSGVMR